MVADPSTATEDTLKNTYQTLFTKYSANSNTLSHTEMCTRLMRSLEDDKRAVRFLLKQFVVETRTAGQRSGNVGRAYEELKKEHTKLQQSMSSQRLQADKTVKDLQHRLQALTGTMTEMQKKIDEKDTQLNQFRNVYAAEGLSRMPPPPSSAARSIASSSRSGGGGSIAAPPPMQVFVENKKRKERERDRERAEMTHRGVPPIAARRPPTSQRHHDHDFGVGSSHMQQHPFNGGSGSDGDSMVTPIVPPPHHHRVRSSSSFSPHGGNGNSNIRGNLAAGTGYTFTSRSKRPRTGGSMYSRSGGGGGFGRY